MKQLLCVALLCALAGCSTKLKPDEESALPYGELRPDYQEVVKSQYNLKDPYSAVWTFTTPLRGYYRGGFAVGARPTAGWLVQGTLNAKNSFGGYEGATPFKYLLFDDRIMPMNDVGMGLWHYHP